MYSSTQFCESLATDGSDIFGRDDFLDDFFLATERSPIHISSGELSDGGEIPICSSYDAYSVSFFDMTDVSESGSLLDLPSSTDLSESGSFLDIPSPAYHMDLVAAEDSKQGIMNINNNSDSSLQTAESQTEPAYSPLDLMGLPSYSVISIPMRKVCRGRRVPTVEMVQKRVVKPADYTEKKPGRDTFAERRFVCVYVDCRKCFKRREHLVRHQRSAHSPEKPFKCPINGCFVSCNRKDNMHQHMRNAHSKSKPIEL